jgi:hypothetical protein
MSISRRRRAAAFGAALLCAAVILLHACSDKPTEPGTADEIAARAGAAQKYRLTLSGAGSTASGTLVSSRGGVNCTITFAAGRVSTKGTCAKDLKGGLVLSITANPSPGSLVTWTGCDAPVTENPLACQVTMSSPRTVAAAFSPPPNSYFLSITGGANGSGTVTSAPAGISCAITAGSAGPGCSASFPSASSVALTASAAGGSYLKAWSGAGCDAAGTGGGTGTGGCDVQMSQPQALVVSFEAASDEASVGRWESPIPWPIVAIHAHLLPNGKVLTFGRMHENPAMWNPGAPGSGGSFESPGHPGDLFCSGHSLLPDGRLLVAGGHSGTDNFGTLTTYLYDGALNSWSRGQDMRNGRWYPTNTTLATGDVLTISGGDTAGVRNLIPEVWENGTWRALTGAARSVPYYPMMFAAPDGRVFMAGPEQRSRWLSTSGTGGWTDGALRIFGSRDYGSAVMYDAGKVLVAGGGSTPTSSAEVIDLNGGTGAAWRGVGSLAVARRQLNMTLLADGTVLATGGSNAAGFNTAPTDSRVLDAEVWNPSTEQWRALGRMSHHRLYHSVALLLPDGRVLSVGSGGPPASGLTNDYTAELYSPPYLFRLDGTPAVRPTITDAPVSVSYGEAFAVQTPDAARIAWATWIRLSSVTHAFNQNQRMNRLTTTPNGASSVTVMAPPSANHAPPGHYMLFLIDTNGVPSIAKIIRIG